MLSVMEDARLRAELDTSDSGIRAKVSVSQPAASWDDGEDRSTASIGRWSVEVVRVSASSWAWRAFARGRESHALGGRGLRSCDDAKREAEVVLSSG